MWIIATGCIGFIMDCILGDPAWLPHPVRLIGWWISVCERGLRRIFPQTPKGERAAGAALAAAVLLFTFVVWGSVLWLCLKISFWLYTAVGCILCWQIFAAKCLKTETEKVQRTLEKGDLPASREQIAMLVGRDTQQLDGEHIAKAAVETVAENTSDGVIAPMFWLMIGGPIAGMMYKAVNTMDSMIGYKNDRYRYFGTCAARLDDIANWIPARLTALAVILSAFVLGFDGKNSWRIWRRDRRKHSSPNSAHPESACAGALGIQLAGNASYFGKVCEKPCIGDPVRPIEAEDIGRSSKLMYASSIIMLAAFSLLRTLLTVL